MRFTLLAGAATLTALLASPALGGDCPGDDGYKLSVLPPIVPIGTQFTVKFQAPNGTFIVLILSSSPGPTPTPYGTLCVGEPFAGYFPITMPNNCSTLEVPHLVECVPAIVGVSGYFQYLAQSPNDTRVHKSNGASIKIVDGECDDPIHCGDLVTYTQCEWGEHCCGGNFGCFRDANFCKVFPHGLIVGDPNGPDGDQIWALKLTSSHAVEDFLPESGYSHQFTCDLVDPHWTPAGAWGGELVAAKLNVAFDDAGLFDPKKNKDQIKLGDLVFVKCVHPKLLGKSVREVIAISELAISRAVSVPVDVDGDNIGDVQLWDLRDALEDLNENFADGHTNKGCLAVSYP